MQKPRNGLILSATDISLSLQKKNHGRIEYKDIPNRERKD
jgi:hypothetical protein